MTAHEATSIALQTADYPHRRTEHKKPAAGLRRASMSLWAPIVIYEQSSTRTS
jgi:hypothetical protein